MNSQRFDGLTRALVVQSLPRRLPGNPGKGAHSAPFHVHCGQFTSASGSRDTSSGGAFRAMPVGRRQQ